MSTKDWVLEIQPVTCERCGGVEMTLLDPHPPVTAYVFACPQCRGQVGFTKTELAE